MVCVMLCFQENLWIQESILLPTDIVTATLKSLTTADVFGTEPEQSPWGFFTIHRTALWNCYFTVLSAHKAQDYIFIFQVLSYMKKDINFKTKASGGKRQIGNWRTGLPVYQQARAVICH